MTKEDSCSLCDEGRLKVGEKSGYGAAVVLKTGSDVEKDWYATLQPGTMTDPQRGIHCLLMPLGHIGSFSGMYTADRNLSKNFGVATAVLSYAMQEILGEEHEDRAVELFDLHGEGASGIFVPQQIIYGKHAEGRNTKPGHIHWRFTDFSGGLAQAYPSDNAWRNMDVLKDEAGKEYVKALPTKSQRFSPERFERLRRDLVRICSSQI